MGGTKSLVATTRSRSVALPVDRAMFSWLATEQVTAILACLPAEELAWTCEVCKDWAAGDLQAHLWRLLVLARWSWVGENCV